MALRCRLRNAESESRVERRENPMKTDAEIRRDVETELKWDPSVEDSGIGVAVSNGIVTLSGQVGRYHDRWTAETITKRVGGVRALANEIEVHIPHAGQRNDSQIAEAAANALSWNSSLSASMVKPVVKDGWVRLTGQVAHWHEKDAAELLVRHLLGVTGVSNEILIKPQAAVADVKKKIEAAFHRQAHLDATNIVVSVAGDKVTLSGKVRSWNELDEAARAAWAAPGIGRVENELIVHV
jgi:osmotically-inducible protein OsmY